MTFYNIIFFTQIFIFLSVICHGFQIPTLRPNVSIMMPGKTSSPASLHRKYRLLPTNTKLCSTQSPITDPLHLDQPQTLPIDTNKLQAKLMKSLRQVSINYKMIENNDHIMCCVSGGKDSATMLHLLLLLQKKLSHINIHFHITAVHLNQMQPGYDGKPLVEWLDKLKKEYDSDKNKNDDDATKAKHTSFNYKIVTEDTYSIVLDKTPENKTYCSMCSRLRRGILYTIAHDIKANKIALGHHGDDAMETLLLNLIHAGQLKSMPARYYSTERNIHVIRPLIHCFEEDIAIFARRMNFPILPCNLCGTQPDAQRAKVKLLLSALEGLNPNAKLNMLNAMGDVRPSHLLDIQLREACGLDGITGETLDAGRAKLVNGIEMNIADQSNRKSCSDEPGLQNTGESLHKPLGPNFIEI